MHFRTARIIAVMIFVAALSVAAQQSAQPDAAAIIHDLDTANQARFDNVLTFTDVEHYAVFRGTDQTHPAAEMTVKMTYKKGSGKDYAILSKSGSSLIQRVGLQPLLDNEKAINNPVKVAQSWLTSANYEMHLKPGVTQLIDGRICLALAITPRHKAPNMIDGTIWIDADTHTLVEVEGIASKSPSDLRRTHEDDAPLRQHAWILDGHPRPRRIKQPALRPHRSRHRLH